MTDSQSSDADPSPRLIGVPGSADRYEALLDVLDERAEQARAADRPLPRGGGERVRYVMLAVLTIFSAWIWVAPPGWLGLRTTEPRPIAEEEAALRFGMYLQAQRIKAFRLDAGRLPRELEEAGQPMPGMTYHLIDPTIYELVGKTDRVTLAYRSDTSLQEFVGPGADVIDESVIP